MRSMYAIARITVLEVMQMRIFLSIACMLLFILPVVAMVFSNIFIFDLGKVRVDVLASGLRLLIIAFIIFVAVALLARDFAQKACYQFLSPPMTRHSFLLGRFIGLSICMLILMIVAVVALEFTVWISQSQLEEIYRRGIESGIGVLLASFTYYQHLSILAMVFMICTWATGLAEMLVFSGSAIFLTWVLPPIIQALQTKEVLEHVPPAVATITRTVGELLPQLNGGEIALAFAHGIPIQKYDVIFHLIEHTGYTLIMLALALIIFSRRDL